MARFHPIFERWIIFFGLLYIIVVLLFPAGIVGTLRTWIRTRGGGRPGHERKAASRPVRKEEAG
ncbi:hypothetical protein J6TS7_08380 [Paenibacillus dendritiformis]|nr:hypothetical protein J6TS7_08380 [Paenibacillus dendritiformis]